MKSKKVQFITSLTLALFVLLFFARKEVCATYVEHFYESGNPAYVYVCAEDPEGNPITSMTNGVIRQQDLTSCYCPGQNNRTFICNQYLGAGYSWQCKTLCDPNGQKWWDGTVCNTRHVLFRQAERPTGNEVAFDPINSVIPGYENCARFYPWCKGGEGSSICPGCCCDGGGLSCNGEHSGQRRYLYDQTLTIPGLPGVYRRSQSDCCSAMLGSSENPQYVRIFAADYNCDFVGFFWSNGGESIKANITCRPNQVAPQVISVTPSSGWSGISGSSGPGGCSPNNPVDLTVVYSDANGANDIERVGLWIDDVSPHVNNQYSSVHAIIDYQGGQWVRKGMRCDTSGTQVCGTETGCSCYKNYVWDVGNITVPSDEGTGISSPTDPNDHTDTTCTFDSCADRSAAWTTVGNIVKGANTVTVTYRVWFSNDHPIGNNLLIFGYVKETAAAGGKSDGWRSSSHDATPVYWTRNLDFENPTVGITAPVPTGTTISATWVGNDNGRSGFIYTERQCQSDPSGGSCTAPGPLNLSSFTSLSGITIGAASFSKSENLTVINGYDYLLDIQAWDRVCNKGVTTPVRVSIAKNWFLTAYGDTYASGDYDSNMKMWQKNSFQNNILPTGLNAYFSSYIISKGANNSTWVTRASWGNSGVAYFLKNYNDANRTRVGLNNLYSYFSGRIDDTTCATAAGGSVTVVRATTLDNVAYPSCSGKKIFLINGNVSLGSGWVNQPLDSTRACLIIASGNITVPVGSGTIDNLDAFLMADGNVVTTADSSPLQIHGSVIANTIDFNRQLTNVASDPTEVIRYNGKYLDLLNACLGESYPFQVREVNYSTTSP